jgi:hypothetical protein
MARSRERMACLRAFQYSHWFGLVVLVGIVVHYGAGS